jgi:hypothetical protein
MGAGASKSAAQLQRYADDDPTAQDVATLADARAAIVQLRQFAREEHEKMVNAGWTPSPNHQHASSPSPNATHYLPFPGLDEVKRIFQQLDPGMEKGRVDRVQLFTMGKANRSCARFFATDPAAVEDSPYSSPHVSSVSPHMATMSWSKFCAMVVDGNLVTSNECFLYHLAVAKEVFSKLTTPSTELADVERAASEDASGDDGLGGARTRLDRPETAGRCEPWAGAVAAPLLSLKEFSAVPDPAVQWLLRWQRQGVAGGSDIADLIGTRVSYDEFVSALTGLLPSKGPDGGAREPLPFTSASSPIRANMHAGKQVTWGGVYQLGGLSPCLGYGEWGDDDDDYCESYDHLGVGSGAGDTGDGGGRDPTTTGNNSRINTNAADDAADVATEILTSVEETDQAFGQARRLFQKLERCGDGVDGGDDDEEGGKDSSEAVEKEGDGTVQLDLFLDKLNRSNLTGALVHGISWTDYSKPTAGGVGSGGGSRRISWNEFSSALVEGGRISAMSALSARR